MGVELKCNLHKMQMRKPVLAKKKNLIFETQIDNERQKQMISLSQGRYIYKS